MTQEVYTYKSKKVIKKIVAVHGWWKFIILPHFRFTCFKRVWCQFLSIWKFFNHTMRSVRYQQVRPACASERHSALLSKLIELSITWESSFFPARRHKAALLVVESKNWRWFYKINLLGDWNLHSRIYGDIYYYYLPTSIPFQDFNEKSISDDYSITCYLLNYDFFSCVFLFLLLEIWETSLGLFWLSVQFRDVLKFEFIDTILESWHKMSWNEEYFTVC